MILDRLSFWRAVCAALSLIVAILVFAVSAPDRLPELQQLEKQTAFADGLIAALRMKRAQDKSWPYAESDRASAEALFRQYGVDVPEDWRAAPPPSRPLGNRSKLHAHGI